MNADALQARLTDQPRLMAECVVTPTVIRQEHWVILKNPITGGYARLHSDLWSVVQELDGTCSLQQWLQTHASVFGDRHLLSAVLQLQRTGILRSPADNLAVDTPYSSLLSRRNPLMLRVPLFNPSSMLDGLCRASSLVSVRYILIVPILALSLAIYAVMMNWSAVLQQWKAVSDGAFVWHLMLLYPLTKCLHELAHGWALRKLEGEVPEAGLSLIVLFPMPYVDATDAWSLQRSQRMLVTSAGMLMDLLVASLGILLWLTLSSGVLSDMAFSVAVMGFASVVLFNANPLLKFDGYYLLEDALDSPGLARRSMAYYRYLCKRYLLFMERCCAPVLARGEIPWLLSYGFLSTLYRFFIAVFISYYLLSTFHELGAALSLFVVVPLCIAPVYRFLRFLCFSNELGEQRVRTVSVVMVMGMFVFGFLFSVPMPSATRTQGVVWVEQQAEVFAAQAGELESVHVSNGDTVVKDQLLMTLRSDEVAFDWEKKQSAVRLARLEVSRHRYSDPGQARSAVIGLHQAQNELDMATKQIDKLTILAPVSGRIALSVGKTSTGSAVSQGDLLAYVVSENERVVRAVVDQSALGKVESGVQGVRVRLPQDISVSRQAKITRQVPSGNHELPSAALIDTGFGGFKVSPTQQEASVQTLDKVFHLELVLLDTPDKLLPVPMGSRAYVTFEHAREPLAQRWVRLSRQLLLKHLSV